MFDPVTTFLLFTSMITGALFYRMRGSSIATWPRPLEQMMFCLVFGFVMGIFGAHFGWQIPGYVLSVFAVLTGHGQYFLKRMDIGDLEAMEPEKLDFIVASAMGADPRTNEKYAQWCDDNMCYGDDYLAAMTDIDDDVEEYGRRKLFWRCVLGMAITGGAVSLAPGLVVMFATPHFLAGLVLALSGFVAKPLAYLVWFYINESTEHAEWTYGGLQWFVAVLLAIVTVGMC